MSSSFAIVKKKVLVNLLLPHPMTNRPSESARGCSPFPSCLNANAATRAGDKYTRLRLDTQHERGRGRDEPAVELESYECWTVGVLGVVMG